jgi:hypothetical protein
MYSKEVFSVKIFWLFKIIINLYSQSKTKKQTGWLAGWHDHRLRNWEEIETLGFF